MGLFDTPEYIANVTERVDIAFAEIPFEETVGNFGNVNLEDLSKETVIKIVTIVNRLHCSSHRNLQKGLDVLMRTR